MEEISKEILSEFVNLLSEANLKIIKYDQNKSRPILFSGARNMESYEKAQGRILERLGTNHYIKRYSSSLRDILQISPSSLYQAYCQEYKIGDQEDRLPTEIPPGFEDLTLNIDVTEKKKELSLLLTNSEDRVLPIGGFTYLKIMGIKEQDAISMARKIIPEYSPHAPLGLHNPSEGYGLNIPILNTYTPAPWRNYKGPIPDRLPEDFKKLMRHLFPIKLERSFFYAWVKASMISRAFTYLILCGNPGIGKNRLKLILRALHGHLNTVDGKKSTLTDRFNSQLAESTLTWFDELRYDSEMENVMKEIQNDTISIERKGVDATRSTKIHSSLIVSNNKPRDNYIAFDARKFVPLVMTKNRLEASMTPQEIAELTSKVETEGSPTFDVAYIAQIGRWILKHGDLTRWPNLEYRGPMFFKLAHTSMTRWQRKTLVHLLELKRESSGKVVYNQEKGFLWSSIEGPLLRKEKLSNFPERSTIMAFFEVFLDASGEKTFNVIPTQDSITGDFWVKAINPNFKVTDEAQVSEEHGLNGRDGDS